MKVKDEVLRCSECDCDWTQPYQVEVFNRASEDNDKGLHVTIAGQVITQADDVSRDAGNPSKRGSGVRLLFHTVLCAGSISEIFLAQMPCDVLAVRPFKAAAIASDICSPACLTGSSAKWA